MMKPHQFSDREKKDIAAATAVLSIAFGIGFMEQAGIVMGLIISLFVVGIGFILHELAHRQVARRFGAVAEFRAYPFGLVLALIFAVATNGGFVFAAPGAVYISQHKQGRWHRGSSRITLEENGVISFAGPLVNIALATVFLLINYFVGSPLLVLAANVNLFLALFNMLPMHPLDGAKVMAWDRKVWLAGFLVALIGWLL